jgi:RNA polymerase sigma-70 factor (ECF subfamily)
MPRAIDGEAFQGRARGLDAVRADAPQGESFLGRARPASLSAVGPATEIDPLVARAQRGDRGAFTELFRRHRADVARLVFRLLGRPADVEDVIQEVFLQVHRSLGDFRGQSRFSTWLHRVTVNVVLMARRSARSRPVFAEPPAREPASPRAVAPDEEVARLRRIEAFQRLLERLPEKKRVVFVLHELEGMAPADIAAVVDAPVLTVRTRLFYARKELCDLMQGEPALASLVPELGVDRARVSFGGSRRAGGKAADGGSDEEAP